MKAYLFSVIRSASFYPLGIFWLISMGVVPSIVAEWVDLDMGLLVLTVTAGVLVLIANYRDTTALRKDLLVVHSQLVTIEESINIVSTDPNTNKESPGD